MREIGRERLPCHKMDWNGVGGKCVKHNEVVPRRRSCQSEPCIAEHDGNVRLARRYEVEEARVFRDLDHIGINFEEGPVLSVARMACKTAGTEPDNGDLPEHSALCAAGRHNAFGDRSAEVI